MCICAEEGKSGNHGRRDIREIPWREIFSHPTSLTLMLNNWTFGWIGYMVLTELPTYLTDVLGTRWCLLHVFSRCVFIG